jgi:hypothetical protein
MLPDAACFSVLPHCAAAGCATCAAFNWIGGQRNKLFLYELIQIIHMMLRHLKRTMISYTAS